MSAKGEATETAVKEKSSVKKVLGIIVNVFLWIFVVFCALITILTFTQTAGSHNVPAVGNKMIVAVKTDSMKPQDGDNYEVAGFDKGDIIIVRQIDEAEALTLKVGDVISYDYKDLDGDGNIDMNTHRIVQVLQDETGKIIGYTTKGDNVPMVDNDPVLPRSVVGRYEGKKIPWVGNVLLFLQTRLGFGLVIVLPLVIFFVVELILFIRKFIQMKNAGKKQITEADEELIRQRAIEEYIRKQQEQAGGQAEAVKEEVKAVTEEAEAVKKEVEADLSEAKEAVSETVSEAEKQAEEAVSEVKEKVDETVEKVAETAEQVTETAEKVKDAVTPDKAE